MLARRGLVDAGKSARRTRNARVPVYNLLRFTDKLYSDVHCSWIF